MRQRLTGRGLRRYPALGLVVAAAALALFLPSALNIPQSGPSSLAEFAPVPGQSTGRNDLSSVGDASSGSTGFGLIPGDVGDAGRDSVGAPGQRRPQLKRCVGNPPRQTEDPLSPPCVAFFDGDNGGATSNGVSRDEVSVSVKLTVTSASTDRQGGNIVDCGQPPRDDDTFPDSLCKGYMKYFNDRYQTYNRTVHLYSVHGGVNFLDVIRRYNPFAHADQRNNEFWTRNKVMSVAYSGRERASYQSAAPYQISFRADEEDQIAQMASYVCDKLAGRRARYSGDPTRVDAVRKFGIIFHPDLQARKDKAKVQIRERCGVDINTESSAWETPVSVAAMRNAGVTTVIMFLVNLEPITVTNNATEIAYFPEWFVPGSVDLFGIDINFFARRANQVQWSNAFGLTYDYRRKAISEQNWYRAYKDGCPSCPEPGFEGGGSNAVIAPATYDSLTMLFYGIQAAGPRLTPDNIDKGLHAIPARASDDPFRPAAYFAPGNYSFVKDAVALWWDPSGTPPGGAPNSGCYRLPYDGRRFRAGEWPRGDDDVQMSGPCQADTVQ